MSTPSTPHATTAPGHRTLRPGACLGLMVAALAIASIGLGRFVVLPMLVRAHALVDANLARSLAGPIHFRLAEITLAATLVTFVVLPRWTRSRLAGGLAMVLVIGAAAWRAVMLPALYAAWSRVDLVAGRPLDRMQEAAAIDGYEQALSLALMFTLIATAWIALRTADARPLAKSATNPVRMSAAGTIDVESPGAVAGA